MGRHGLQDTEGSFCRGERREPGGRDTHRTMMMGRESPGDLSQGSESGMEGDVVGSRCMR